MLTYILPPSTPYLVVITCGAKMEEKHSAVALDLRPSAQFEPSVPMAFCFPGTFQGIQELTERLLDPLRDTMGVEVALAAEGPCWLLLYEALRLRSYNVHLLAAAQPRLNADSTWATKTDRLDARTIGQLLCAGQAIAEPAPPTKILELRVMTRYQNRLLDMRGVMEEINRTAVALQFPEYGQLFQDLYQAPGPLLMHAYGLAPRHMAGHGAAIECALESMGRKEDALAFLHTAAASIGHDALSQVLALQIRSSVNLIEHLGEQIQAIDRRLDAWDAQTPSPLKVLRLPVRLTAALHAESHPITRFGDPNAFEAFVGLRKQSMGRPPAGLLTEGSPAYLRQALRTAARKLMRNRDPLSRGQRELRKVMRQLTVFIWRTLTNSAE